MSKNSSKEKYSTKTIQELKTICKAKGIKGYSGLKKTEIIDLILQSSDSEKVPEKTKAQKVAPKKKGPGKTTDEQIKDAAKELLEDPTKNPSIKITKRAPDKSVEEKISDEMKAVKQKPSGILYVSNINNAMQNIEMYIEAGDRVKAVENAEQIKEYLDGYSFTPQFEKAMKTSIRSVIEAFGSPSVKKKIVKRTPYKKGEYKTVEIERLKICKKGDAPPNGRDAPKKISITLEEFRKEIDDDDFIKEYTQSVRDLMKAKVGLYLKRKAETELEYQSIDRKVKKLKAMGTDDRAIRDMYPGFDGLKVFIIDLEDLIALVRKRATEITEAQIREGLIDAIDDSDNGLNSIIGRDELKNQLASQIYSFSKGYKTFMGSFNNIAIYGAAGVGKTRLATVIAFALSKIGILARDTVKIVTRADLVGQYIGHTAPRTRSALIETLEGILFIDEAYQLTPEDPSRDFGSEAITEIVNFLDKYIGLNIVIVAGYEGIMTRRFMTFNEGLPRRFPYRYILSPYSDEELTDILITNLKKKLPEKNKLDSETGNFIFSLISKIRTEIPDAFKNQAGDMLNLSASLNKTISSSFQIQWRNGDLKNNTTIIYSGFEDFLETKGFSLYA